MEDESGGLFNIEVDEESGKDVDETEKVKVPRDFQSEEDFERQKREWRPKCEVGEVCFLSMFPLKILKIEAEGNVVKDLEDIEAAN